MGEATAPVRGLRMGESTAPLRDLASIYLRLAGSRIRSQMVYRASFVLMIFGQMVLSFTDFLMIAVLFTHIDAMRGWSIAEVGVLYGVSQLSMRGGDMFFGQVEHVPNFIRTGAFDTILVRPLGSLFQILTTEFFVHQAGAMIQAVTVLVVAVTRAGIDWSPARAGMLVAAMLSGFVIFAAIFVVTNSVAFWLIDSREIANSFTYGGGMLAEYPLGIFGRWMRRLFVYVFPVAFVTYFPLLFVLGKTDTAGFPSAFRFLSPVVAVAAALVAGRVWRLAVRHYRSTGS